MIVPMYIGELAPAKYRGRMIAFNNMSVTFGQLLASAIGAGLAEVPGQGWRGTVGIGAVPAIALGIMLFWCPESPRQLVAHGNVEQADKVLVKLYHASTREQRLAKIRAIEIDIEEATTGLAGESLWVSFKRIFNTPASGRAVFTACFVMAISQLGGFNTLMYYSATLFRIVGFSNAAAVAIVSVTAAQQMSLELTSSPGRQWHKLHLLPRQPVPRGSLRSPNPALRHSPGNVHLHAHRRGCIPLHPHRHQHSRTHRRQPWTLGHCW
jgi:MFS family permease